MKDFLSIKEFSELTGIETSTLRYWDEIGLFSPLKRNPANNYRYYSLVQILALNFVTVLSDLDLPLKTIAELRRERNPEKFMRLMDKQEMQMDMEMRSLRMRYSIIHARRELINYGMKVDENEISVMYRDDKAMILWPKNEYTEGDSFIEPLTTFIRHTPEHHINLSFPVGGYHKNFESFRKAPGQPDNFISIDPVGIHVRKAGDYLVGFTRGYYGDLGDVAERMFDHAEKNSLRITGPVYTMYLHDEICVKKPEDYLAQTCVAVTKKRTDSKKK